MFHIWYYFLLLVIFYNYQLIASDESCKITENPKLQVVFVVSQTLNRTNENPWARYQYWTAGNITDAIKAQFPDSTFSVVGFVDYPDSAQPRETRSVTETEHCYFVTQPPTKNTFRIVAAIKNRDETDRRDNYKGDLEDSVTAAMLFAAVDKKLRWTNGFYDSRGKLVRKIMIPMVWKKITKVLNNPGRRTKPKADGTDKCSTALLPTFTQLSNVLYENGFAVFNSILNSIRYKGHLGEDEYTKHFASLLVPYYQFPIPQSGKKAEWEESGGYDYKGYANRMVQQIKEEVMTCDWEDPKGYNSLGL